jgi:hypothetical protein
VAVPTGAAIGVGLNIAFTYWEPRPSKLWRWGEHFCAFVVGCVIGVDTALGDVVGAHFHS